MQVLMLVINQKGKGTYFRTFEFARQLVARGHEVTLLATSPANRLKHSVSHRGAWRDSGGRGSASPNPPRKP